MSKIKVRVQSRSGDLNTTIAFENSYEAGRFIQADFPIEVRERSKLFYLPRHGVEFYQVIEEDDGQG